MQGDDKFRAVYMETAKRFMAEVRRACIRCNQLGATEASTSTSSPVAVNGA